MPAMVNQCTYISVMQVLREPSTRMAYNQQLALEAAQQQVFVSQTIVLADMEPVQLSTDDSTGESVSTAYQYPCRCGGAHWLDAMMLKNLEGRSIVQCDTCSSNIEVCLNYS